MQPTMVGTEVRRARTALGWTLQKLSDETDRLGRRVPVRTIHGIENGESRYPTEHNLRSIGDALEPETSYRELALLVYGLATA